MRRFAIGAGILAMGCGFSGAALAQARTPPAIYWMSVETNNMTLPGMPSGMGGFLGGQALGMPGGGPRRSLLLQLGSPRSASGEPQAEHQIPPGQRMGNALPLTTPTTERGQAAERDPSSPGEAEKPRAKLLFY